MVENTYGELLTPTRDIKIVDKRTWNFTLGRFVEFNSDSDQHREFSCCYEFKMRQKLRRFVHRMRQTQMTRISLTLHLSQETTSQRIDRQTPHLATTDRCSKCPTSSKSGIPVCLSPYNLVSITEDSGESSYNEVVEYVSSNYYS